MSDAYVYGVAFSISFHCPVENAKFKAPGALWAMGGNEFPNAQCEINVACA